MLTMATIHKALDTPSDAGNFAAEAARNPPCLRRWLIEAVIGIPYVIALPSFVSLDPTDFLGVVIATCAFIPIAVIIGLEMFGTDADERWRFARLWMEVSTLREHDAEIEARAAAGQSSDAIAEWLTSLPRPHGPITTTLVQTYRDAMIDRRLATPTAA